MKKNTFRVRHYELRSKKIRGAAGVRFAVLSDLHGLSFGKNNELLVRAVRAEKPDAVLVAGDMITRTSPRSLDIALCLLKELVKDFPVYYAQGNHELRMSVSEKLGDAYVSYERELTGAGVCFLHNEKISTSFHGTEFIFHGLELPREYYRKPKSPRLSLRVMEQILGHPCEPACHILLAHNPKYGATYFSWGADLTLSGHYHGGVVRFGEKHGLTSPQYLLFPPYCCGHFRKNDRDMIVSAGLGEHTIPLRIHNPRELLVISILPEKAAAAMRGRKRQREKRRSIWRFR